MSFIHHHHQDQSSSSSSSSSCNLHKMSIHSIIDHPRTLPTDFRKNDIISISSNQHQQEPQQPPPKRRRIEIPRSSSYLVPPVFSITTLPKKPLETTLVTLPLPSFKDFVQNIQRPQQQQQNSIINNNNVPIIVMNNSEFANINPHDTIIKAMTSPIQQQQQSMNSPISAPIFIPVPKVIVPTNDIISFKSSFNGSFNNVTYRVQPVVAKVRWNTKHYYYFPDTNIHVQLFIIDTKTDAHHLVDTIAPGMLKYSNDILSFYMFNRSLRNIIEIVNQKGLNKYLHDGIIKNHTSTLTTTLTNIQEKCKGLFIFKIVKISDTSVIYETSQRFLIVTR